MGRMGDAPVQNIHFTGEYKDEEMGTRELVLFLSREEGSTVERGGEKRNMAKQWETRIIEGYGERIMNTYNLEFETRRC
jgi:hypothetical protein